MQTTNKNKLIRVFKYCRVSTSKQAKKGESLQDQDEVLDRYIAEHDNMVCVGTFCDGGKSGRKIDRGDFKDMIRGIENHECDLVIFTRIDRWFRNLRHYLNTNAILEKNGVEWKAVEQKYYETRTAAGRAFVANSMSFAQFLAENNAETIIEHNKAKVYRGEVLSGKVPLGYKIENKHLVFSDQHDILVAVLDEWDRTNSINHCVRFLLNEYGISMAQSNFKKSILMNTKLAGYFRDNMNYCPATVSIERFQNWQRLLKINVKSNVKYEYIFSGLVVCDECGHSMSGCQQRAGRKKDGTPYKYSSYKCRYAMSLKTCSNRKVMYESSLEKYIVANVKTELEKYIIECEIEDKPKKDNRQKIINLEKKLDKLKDLYLNEIIDINEYKVDRAKIKDQIDSIAETERNFVPKDLTKLKEFLNSDFETMYSVLDIPEKRMLWRSLIKEIRVDKDKNIRIIFL